MARAQRGEHGGSRSEPGPGSAGLGEPSSSGSVDAGSSLLKRNSAAPSRRPGEPPVNHGTESGSTGHGRARAARRTAGSLRVTSPSTAARVMNRRLMTHVKGVLESIEGHLRGIPQLSHLLWSRGIPRGTSDSGHSVAVDCRSRRSCGTHRAGAPAAQKDAGARPKPLGARGSGRAREREGVDSANPSDHIPRAFVSRRCSSVG